jgi:uncharacterized membrane protein
MISTRTWRCLFPETLNFGQRVAGKIANGMDSWRLIICQAFIVILWVLLNYIAFINHWNLYLSVLLNLLFSTEAVYATPVIMIAQNRRNDRDRLQATAEYENNVEVKKEIEPLRLRLDSIEADKLRKSTPVRGEWKDNNKRDPHAKKEN